MGKKGKGLALEPSTTLSLATKPAVSYGHLLTLAPSRILADRYKEQNYQNIQHRASALHPMDNINCLQQPSLDLVGHSIAFASNPYPGSYYGGLMPACGPMPMVPHVLEMQQPRVPLPLDVTQEPVYVNAKQYHGILRRRQSRAKAELEKKLIKIRKPYLHESRHQHALRRQRGMGGRFAGKGDLDATKSGEENGSESENNHQQPEAGEQERDSNAGDECQSSGGFHTSMYSAFLAKGHEQGSSQRALAIK